MKVVAFNGSPRKGGNTERLLRYVLEVLEQDGIATELVQIGGRRIHGCTACRQCFERQDEKCVIKNDIINSCIAKMVRAEGILIGSPTYFADLSRRQKHSSTGRDLSGSQMGDCTCAR